MATKIERILAPARGLNTFDGPSAIPKDSAPELVNFLPGAAGKIMGRGKLEAIHMFNSGTGSALYDWALASGVSLAYRGLLDLDADSATIPFGEKLIVSVDGKSGLLTFTDSYSGAGTYVDLGSRTFKHSRGNAQIDSITYVLNTAVSPRVINSVDQSGTVVAYSTNAPRNGTFIFTYLDTLWVFGGRDTPAGSTTDRTSMLYYVNPGTTPADTVAAWQTNGITNRINVGEGSLNDAAVAAVPFRRSLLLFKEHSLYQMIGSSPENFEVRKIADVGCTCTPVATERAVYWRTDSGGWAKFEGEIVAEAFPQIRDRYPTNPTVALSKLSSDRLLISLPTVWGNVDGSESFVYDERTNTISELTVVAPSAAAATISSPLAATVSTQPLARAIRTQFDGDEKLTFLVGSSLAMLYSASLSFPYPETLDDPAVDLNYGTATRMPYSRTLYSWTSRTVRSSSPTDKVRLVKLYVDYICQTAQFDSVSTTTSYDEDDDSSPVVLYVRVLGEDGTVLLAEEALPGQGWNGSTGPNTDLDRRRHIIDLGGAEAAEYKVEIYTKQGSQSNSSPAWTGDDLEFPIAGRLEIHDVWVEYEEAQRRVAV